MEALSIDESAENSDSPRGFGSFLKALSIFQATVQ